MIRQPALPFDAPRRYRLVPRLELWQSGCLNNVDRSETRYFISVIINPVWIKKVNNGKRTKLIDYLPRHIPPAAHGAGHHARIHLDQLWSHPDLWLQRTSWDHTYRCRRRESIHGFTVTGVAYALRLACLLPRAIVASTNCIYMTSCMK